jgi:hypothetical protein
MPTAVLLQSAIASNSALFAKFCKERKISFAPHGKTTMSPELFDIQMRDGAWGITAATAFQARTMIEHGVPRVLIANEVVASGEYRMGSPNNTSEERSNLLRRLIAGRQVARRWSCWLASGSASFGVGRTGRDGW